MIDIRRLVLDANIMVSALLGTSFPFLVSLIENDVILLAPEQQLAETRKTLLNRPKASSNWVDAQMERLNTVVIALPASLFGHHEKVARSRLHQRGQPDWPVLAASFEMAAAIWSHDKDFFGSGAPVWSTKILRKQMGLI
jgi:predicted nucleic acid-binding protein